MIQLVNTKKDRSNKAVDTTAANAPIFDNDASKSINPDVEA